MGTSDEGAIRRPAERRSKSLISRRSAEWYFVGGETAMLTTRPTKRDKVGLFNTDMMFDIVDGETPIGSVVYDKKARRAMLGFGGRTYTVERSSDRGDEMVYQALLRVLTGGQKPPPNPFALKDDAGRTLALAEPVKNGFAVSRGEESFSFRKVGRPYQLHRQGRDQSLGTVGRTGFFSGTLHMDLPAEFDPPFQAFLLALLLDVTMQSLDNSASYSG